MNDTIPLTPARKELIDKWQEAYKAGNGHDYNADAYMVFSRVGSHHINQAIKNLNERAKERYNHNGM